MLASVVIAGIAFAHPRYGRHHFGHRHHYGPRYHHHHHHYRPHHHHCGWGIAAAAIGTAAIVRDIVNPAPVVVAPATTVIAPAPVVVPAAPVVVPAPAPVVVTQPTTTIYR